MGSAKVYNVQPQSPMAETDKKSLKKILKDIFKKDKKKDKLKNEEAKPTTPEIEKPKPNAIAEKTVENILEKIQKLDIKCEENDEDELNNFSFKTVVDEDKDDRTKSNCSDDISYKVVDERVDRTNSHSSEDSGFTEKYTVESDDEKNDDDVIVSLNKLSLEEKRKEKKVQTVVITRTPIRNKTGDLIKKPVPYYVQQTDPCRQIQVNKHTLTGGHVIVNQTTNNDCLEFENAVKTVQETSQNSQHEYGGEWLSIVTEYIQEEEIQQKISDPTEDLLSDFLQTQEIPNPVILTPPHQPPEMTEPNPIEEFSNLSNHLTYQMFELEGLASLTDYADITTETQMPKQLSIFPTPPRSENAASPMSDSTSMYVCTSEYTYSPERSTALSPERSSPICNNDYEKFQDINVYDETPIPCSELEKTVKEKTSSSASMTMKQYKDLQKEISLSFSKKECCKLERKTCKQIFQEHMQRLKVEERRGICLKVANLDLKHAYGVLQHIIKSLARGSETEDLQLALFCLIGERVSNQQPAWFVGDFGLYVLKSVALRCPSRPLLTRYIVECIRAAVKHDSSLVQGRESVFHEVDALGDTLVTACARRGDACADVLSEIVRREQDEMPLFRINHVNSDGASALHVACIEHSASSPRLHIVHVLLEHAGADLWQGDSKAGDTAVHMAVNSRNCDLRLVMILFGHLDRKTWKKLAHAPNMCSTTPLEYARSATKAQSRDNYPTEVLEFLKKCR